MRGNMRVVVSLEAEVPASSFSFDVCCQAGEHPSKYREYILGANPIYSLKIPHTTPRTLHEYIYIYSQTTLHSNPHHNDEFSRVISFRAYAWKVRGHGPNEPATKGFRWSLEL